ncbi:MAG TPA: hypothetical protein VGI75_02840 [Pirellulales bacterium]|jgi:predicted dehydrogenase
MNLQFPPLSILTDKPLTSGEGGLKDLRVMMTAYQSAETGKPVKISL